MGKEIVLGRRESRILLDVLEKNDILSVINESNGNIIYSNPFNLLRYAFDRIGLNEDNTVNIYMRDLLRLWKLAGIYAGIVFIAFAL